MSFIGDNKFVIRWAAGCILITTLSATVSYNMLQQNRNRNYQNDLSVSMCTYTVPHIDGVINCVDVATLEINKPEYESGYIESYVQQYGYTFYVASENPNSRSIINTVSRTVGDRIDINGIHIDVESLMNAYEGDYEYPDWDYKKRINDIHLLWEFLVNQQGVNENIAAAVIGSICFEGKVGMEQSSYATFTNMNDVKVKLSAEANNIGYGLVQWTYPKRRKFLLSNYEYVSSNYDFDWETTCVLAECCTLYSELIDYRLFNSLEEDVDLMHACGVIGNVYENYGDSSLDWQLVDGQYQLINSSGSGANRYVYSQNIIEYFK